jgi:hypothetical protein
MEKRSLLSLGKDFLWISQGLLWISKMVAKESFGVGVPVSVKLAVDLLLGDGVHFRWSIGNERMISKEILSLKFDHFDNRETDA